MWMVMRLMLSSAGARGADVFTVDDVEAMMHEIYDVNWDGGMKSWF